MFGLGKPRSKFGKWVDKMGLTQNDIAKSAKVGRQTVSNICSDKNYVPKISTWTKIEKALKSLGYKVKRDDFFDM
ncbi:helix-turn-helix transcriptional regulator [Metabacillus halosaccharovorans]|uniref:Helix-turn-helix transcriptional regulator n=1 Tax=Metabacillus halosaccharovorans TaxID=930124 RepID=A0ABT3DCA9_9BACI|nr:helix-turn-helix transcriptional regulator [Metabacillus halosaccharovorans]MCV9884688.1 helix-turn-helix transcriptional regulator [Metabacillus halosaccharovorans]